MTNQEAIKIILTERECVLRAADGECDRNCAKCELVMPEGDIIVAYDMAIAALEKQEPVQIRKFGDGTSKCPICRNWLKEDMDFCDKCGQAISWRADDEPYR